jgi:hypothetical protein
MQSICKDLPLNAIHLQTQPGTGGLDAPTCRFHSARPEPARPPAAGKREWRRPKVGISEAQGRAPSKMRPGAERPSPTATSARDKCACRIGRLCTDHAFGGGRVGGTGGQRVLPTHTATGVSLSCAVVSVLIILTFYHAATLWAKKSPCQPPQGSSTQRSTRP